MSFGGSGMPRRYKTVEDANEDEEDLIEWEQQTTRDTVLWLIDAGTKMHDTLTPASLRDGNKADDGEAEISLFHRAMQAAFSFQKSKLVNSPNDLVGIILFNTDETRVEEAGKNVSHPNSVTVQTIRQVDVPSLSELKDDLQNSVDNGPSYFRDKYKPCAKQSRIHHALGNAEAMILNAGKVGSKRIFYVTNEDDPMGDKKGKAEQQRLALEKVKSMTKRGIEFEPFLISTDEHPFDTSLFYADLFSAYNDDEDEDGSASQLTDSSAVKKPWNATTKFETLEDDVGARQTPKRTIFSVPLMLGHGVTIGVRGYCTIVRANKGLPVKVKAVPGEDEDDPVVYKEIVTDTSLACVDTGRELDKDRDVDVAFSFGGDSSLRSKVRFSPNEMKALRMFGQKPSIKILGFKPITELRFYENVKHSYFIYPSDEAWRNSVRAFSALLTGMAKKQKMALAIFCGRMNATPCFAALLPQLEERDEEGQKEPPGMFVIPLPFADDIREPPEKQQNMLVANEEEVEAAHSIVRAYTKNSAFNPDFFPNPALNHHYKVLLAVAFNDEVPQEVDDKTMPAYGTIRKRTGDLITEWNGVIDDDDRCYSSLNNNEDGDGARTSNKKRPADFGNDEEPDLKRRHREGILGTLVNDKLKAACEYYRLPKTGNKAELVTRLNDYLDKVVAKYKKEMDTTD